LAGPETPKLMVDVVIPAEEGVVLIRRGSDPFEGQWALPGGFVEVGETVEEAATAALKEGEKSGHFQIYPIDTEQVRFGRDYFVGDVVTVAADGQEYQEVVKEVNISVEDGGLVTSVTPKIGDQGTGEPLNLYKTVWEMKEKLRKLESRM
jgi:hypothetical protein